MSKAMTVHTRTSKLLGTKLLKKEPAWYQTVLKRPPSTDLAKKPYPLHKSNMRHELRFKRTPPRITYVLDRLRDRFFRDHPWELARPYLVAEGDGRDSYRCDWSRLEQPTMPLNGESVVQHQYWLMTEHEPPMSESESYVEATNKFYDLRQRAETLERISKDEALAFGAQFDKSNQELAFELEEKYISEWPTVEGQA